MTVPTLVILLAGIALLIFCSALFSRVETALFLLKPHQLRRLEQNHAQPAVDAAAAEYLE